MKDKEGELKSAEQKLHEEFERLRRQNAEEKRELDTQKQQLVSIHKTVLRSTYRGYDFLEITKLLNSTFI